jgi:SAM-dependent methyltransferase
VSTSLQRAYAWLVSPDLEGPAVIAMIGPAGPVVDVGCGYGRYLRLLRERGIEAIGVDVNETIVQAIRRDGLQSMTPEEFFRSAVKPRVILMSHVIEHFPPRELVEFMDKWLDRLPPGGELVIATPLMSPHFHDDFDHVKPYHPDGLMMVFGGDRAQVQYWSRHRLDLVDVVFRRSPWRATLARPLYRGGPMAWPYYLANALAALAFRLSFGLLGRKTGWVGRWRRK